MNKQITEDYCSFEIAQLLKEKGFDELCIKKYKDGLLQNAGIKIEEWQNSELDKDEYSAPTHQMALKWLREVYKIHIAVNIGCDVDNKNYVFYTPTIVKLSNKSVEYIEPFSEDDNEFDNNEQAVEAALSYVLKNLI